MNPDKPIKTRWIRFLSYFTFSGKSIRRQALEIERVVLKEKEEFKLKAASVFAKNSKDIPKDFIVLITRAIRFRKQKALVKELLSSLLIPALTGASIIFPIWFSCKTFSFCDAYGVIKLIGIALIGLVLSVLLALLFISVANYFTSIETRISRLGSRICSFLLIGLIHTFAWFLFSKCDCIWVLIPFISCLGLVIIIDGAFAIFVLSQPLPDIYYYSKKVNLTDELILESSYTLASYNNWENIFRKKNRRNLVISEIERLATLIENDWSSHIKVGDERTEKWKQKTLKGIAYSIRKLKREVILPSPTSSQFLSDKFNILFEHILNHNLQGFLQEDIPAYRIKKKSVIDSIRRFIVAVLPFAGALSIYIYFPKFLPEDYKGLPVIIGTGWLILCLLLWLDPQIGEKIFILKSGKNLFSSSPDED